MPSENYLDRHNPKQEEAEEKWDNQQKEYLAKLVMDEKLELLTEIQYDLVNKYLDELIMEAGALVKIL